MNHLRVMTGMFSIVSSGSHHLSPGIRNVWPSFCQRSLSAPWLSFCRRCPMSHLMCYSHAHLLSWRSFFCGLLREGEDLTAQLESTPCSWQHGSNAPVQEDISGPQGLLAIGTTRNTTQSLLVFKRSLCRNTPSDAKLASFSLLQDATFALYWDGQMFSTVRTKLFLCREDICVLLLTNWKLFTGGRHPDW